MFKDKFQVRDSFRKSTRVDSDLSLNFINDLVFHGTAELTLKTILTSFPSKRRAFTVTGPYGSGKSTIALLLSALLDGDSELREAAISKVGTKISNILDKDLPYTNGWLIIKFVGDFEDPIKTISESILRECEINNINVGWKKTVESTSELKILLKSLSEEAVGTFDGVLFIYDEMGKSLDYLNNQKKDLQLFQELAEFTDRAGEVNSQIPMIFTGYMHQSFSGYASSLDRVSRDNWAKVQGRYQDIPFNVSSFETIELLSKSIVQSGVIDKRESINRTLAELNAQGISYLDEKKMYECFPLQPIVALLLGEIAKRQFGQNERSVFNFLLSQERFGFSDWLQSQETENVYNVDDLFEYLESNFEHIIVGSSDGKAWAACEFALVEASKLEDTIYARIVKSIALVNMFGKKLGVTATDELLCSLFCDDFSSRDIKLALDFLENEKKLIIKRIITDSYQIYSGSDLNLDEEEEKFIASKPNDEVWLKAFDGLLNNVLAAQVYHEKGSIRWMSKAIDYAYQNGKYENFSVFDESHISQFVLLIKGNAQELSLIHNDLVFGNVNAELATSLENTAKRLAALNHVEIVNSRLLQSSEFGYKEFQDRKSLYKLQIRRELTAMFEKASWFYNGTKQSGEMVEIASFVAKDCFKCTPKLTSELLNRTSPSAAAVSARTKLMNAMVFSTTEKDLGIEGFPAEKGLYLSVLKNTKLHSYDEQLDIAQFNTDGLDEDLSYLWNKTEEFISNGNGHKTVLDIYQLWKEKPFGIAQGLAPVWVLAYLLSHESSLAFYDKDSTQKFMFITAPDDDFINKMIKRPNEVAVRFINPNSGQENQISAIGRAIEQNLERDEKISVLSLAKSIVRTVHMLSPFVKGTKRLSANTRKFRDLALKASDPHQFVIFDIPSIYGTGSDTKLLELNVATALKELQGAHVAMLEDFGEKIKLIFDGQTFEDIAHNANRVLAFTANPTLKTFSERLEHWARAENSTTTTSEFFSALALKAERHWSDLAYDAAIERLSSLSYRFKQSVDMINNDLVIDNSELLKKDHRPHLEKIMAVIGKLSPREQAIVLQKHLDSIYKDS
ncbi:hypothetical protein BCS96_09160 [Vibrio breoganii]|uniref:hypothetical protein n=1 Tax=Vibrio breoganii TaxID=553239 RepID=UPI000C85E78F|nr:hypothetical protein [Vibrio breoganii]PML88776.1 hypothetical protein BCT68_04670 [Vibrio breoganii]PMO99883.1 hypothetical protein BCS96_09160 [Vibrio breoganii]